MKPEQEASVQTLTLDDDRGPALELIHIPAAGPVPAQRGDPILMIHGAYTDAWSWAPTFMPFFAAHGHDVYALSLRGHGASEGKAALNAWGLADFMKDMTRAQEHIGATPILFGASMGGLLAQRWLTTGRDAVAVVTIGSIPPSGMTGAILRMAWTQPRNLFEIAQVAGSGMPGRRFMRLLVEQPVRAGDPDFYRRHLGRESSRALWELTWMPMVMPTRPDCPVLATHGELDRMVPLDSLDVIERYFGADRMVFEAMGHCPMLEKRWEEAASRIAAWLDERLYSEMDDEQLD